MRQKLIENKIIPKNREAHTRKNHLKFIKKLKDKNEKINSGVIKNFRPRRKPDY